ncbi:MAG: aminoglycoside phosphotransferase family protein [Firmicutes bacterium]|jgi:Ser/Thr protein kinase RdoA (MazF antagonist)|nr:aminoglycoside phosphotransferase family protein [Bacillota bacterium]
MGREFDPATLSKELNVKINRIQAIGNHELGRNLVYQIDTEEGEMVLKIFFKDNRRCREIASLGLLNNLDISIPKLIRYGDMSDGTKWSLKTLLKGKPLSSEKESISQEDMNGIMISLGEDLGKIHGSNELDFYGNWDAQARSIEGFKSYRKRHESILLCIREDIKTKDIPDRNLMLEGIEKLFRDIKLLDKVKKSNITHNDFNYRNILVNNENGKWIYSGLIDFEQCLADFKDRDLVMFDYLYLNRNEKLKEKFYEGYQKYSKKSDFYDDFYRYHLLYLGVYICSWSYNVAREYYEKGRDLVDLLVE